MQIRDRSLALVLAVLLAPHAAADPAIAQPAPLASCRAAGAGGVNEAIDWLECELLANNGIFGSTFDLGDGQGPRFFPDPGLTMDALLALGVTGRADGDAARASVVAVRAEVPAFLTRAGDPRDRDAGATSKTLLTAELLGDVAGTLEPAVLEADLRSLLRIDEPQAGRFSDRSSAGDHSNGFAQSLAIMALSHTGGGVPAPAVSYLLEQQCPSGGFRGVYPFIDGPYTGCQADAEADSDYTALALGALLTSPGTAGVQGAIDDAVSWLRAQQDPATGAFGGTGVTAGLNANSSGLIAQALRAAGEATVADRAGAWIASLQLTTTSAGTGPGAGHLGAIAYDPAAFGDAVANGITEQTQDQFWRSTSQAILAFGAGSFGDVPAPPPVAEPPPPPPSATTVPPVPPAVDVTVLGDSVSPNRRSKSDASAGTLARTGSDTLGLGPPALALIAVGGALVEAGRRRRRRSVPS